MTTTLKFFGSICVFDFSTPARDDTAMVDANGNENNDGKRACWYCGLHEHTLKCCNRRLRTQIKKKRRAQKMVVRQLLKEVAFAGAGAGDGDVEMHDDEQQHQQKYVPRPHTHTT